MDFDEVDDELNAINKSSEAAIIELAKDIDLKMSDKFISFESLCEVFLACAKICNLQLEEFAEKNRPEVRKILKTGDLNTYAIRMAELDTEDLMQLEYIICAFMTRLGYNKKLFSDSLDYYLQGSDRSKARELEELIDKSLGLKPKKNLTADELVLALNKRAEVLSDISGVKNDSIKVRIPDGFNFWDVLAYDQCYLKYGWEREDIEDATKKFQEDPLVVEAMKNLEKATEVRENAEREWKDSTSKEE